MGKWFSRGVPSAGYLMQLSVKAQCKKLPSPYLAFEIRFFQNFELCFFKKKANQKLLSACISQVRVLLTSVVWLAIPRFDAHACHMVFLEKLPVTFSIASDNDTGACRKSCDQLFLGIQLINILSYTDSCK